MYYTMICADKMYNVTLVGRFSLALILVLCLYIWKYWKVLKAARRLPTVTSKAPLLGHCIHFKLRYLFNLNDIVTDFVMRTAVEAGEKAITNYCLWLGLYPFIVTQDPDDIQTILTSTKALEKSWEYELVKFASGDGLLTAPAHIWKPTRKIVQPMFHVKNLKLLIPAFNLQGRQLSGIFKEHEESTTINVYPEIQLLTLKSIIDFLFLKNGHRTSQVLLNSMCASLVRIMRIWTYRVYGIWYRFNLLFNLTYRKEIKTIKQSFYRIINPNLQIRTTTDLSLDENQDISDENGNQLSIHDVFKDRPKDHPTTVVKPLYDTVCNILFAGVDTTSITLSNALMFLAMHSEVQEKLHEEIVSVVGREMRDIQLEDLRSMPLLEQVLKETLRMRPVFPFISRKFTEDVKLSYGVLPAGSSIVLNIYGLHMDPKHFKDPHTFHPERFSTGNSTSRHKFSFIPFSGGSRNCIGKDYAMISLKVTLAQVISKFKLTTDASKEDPKLVYWMELMRKDGYYVYAKPR